jgi:Zn-finger nucleic acid-binding protein
MRSCLKISDCFSGIEMDCPVCNNAMITLELSNIEIDHCVNCGGIWLDSGELEMLLGNPPLAKQLAESFEKDTNSNENPRVCPICDVKMDKIVMGKTNSTLLIDRCPKGHGLWFDKGELKNIFDKAHLDGENKIQKLLTEMFGSG